MKRSVAYIVTTPITAKNFLSGYLADVRSRGWKVTLICAPDSTVREFAQREGVDYCEVEFTRNPTAVKDLAALLRLIRVLSSLSPSVVVYATPKASVLGAIASWVTRVPVRVYEQWGLRLESVEGPFRKILSVMEWMTIRCSTVVVANSYSLARRIESLRLAPQNTITTLGQGSSHGVDVHWFSQANTGPAIDDETEEFLSKNELFTIGFVGRMHPDKGVNVLLMALRECLRRGLRVRCILIGEDEGADLSTEEGLRGSIFSVGRVPDPQPYYRRMDVLVLMSEREGFPNVVLEAAAMGVPAIVSNGTGAVDSVVDGVTGFVVAVRDHWSLADKIQYLVLNPLKLASMGEAARERTTKHFESKAVRALHIDLIDAEVRKRG